LRNYNKRVTEIVNHNCAIIFDSDCDFGVIPTLHFNDQSTCNNVETMKMRLMNVTSLKMVPMPLLKDFVWTSVEEHAFETLKSTMRDRVRANLFTAE
jgi:hypothetical protein